MTQNLFFALDLGSHSVKGILANIDVKNKLVDVVARAEARSSGIRRGIIFDVEDASRSIGEVLRQLEESSKKEINQVNVLIGGPCLETRFAKASIVISRPDEEIGREDERRIQEMVESLPSPQNRTVLHMIPQQGLIAANPLAVAKALVPKRDREQGVCAIDFGAETTSITVFEEDNLVYLSVIPLGSQNITNDIANSLQVHFDTAERIKIGFGQALASKTSKKDEIELSQFVEGEEAVVSRKHLSEIIEARSSEILDFVNDELKKLGKASKLPAGAVIYGGGAELSHLNQLVKKELKLSTRKANLDHFKNYFPEDVPPQYFGAYSLVLWQLDSIFGSRQEGFGRGLPGFMKKLWDIFVP